MKKRFIKMLMITGMLTLAMPTAAYAQNVNNVWIDEAGIEYNETEWKVEVMTDGKSSDGLLEITYDTSLLSVEEEDVRLSENVDMYSVNVMEDGKIKIAYLAEEILEEGVLAEIAFAAIGEQITIDALGITGEVYTPEGNELKVGIVVKETEPQKPAAPETDEKEVTDSVQNVNTGDLNHAGRWSAFAAASLGIIGGIAVKKSKQRRM